MDPYIKHLNELTYRIETISEELAVAEALIESLLNEDLELEEIVILEAEKKKWIQKAIQKEGSLRKTLKIKKGEKIPQKKLEAAAKKGGKTGKRARLAMTLKKLNENGVTTQFNDADDTNPNDEQIATVPDADTGSAGYEKLRDIAYNMQSAMLSKKIPLNSEALKKAFDAIQAHPYHKTAAANSAATERIMRAGGMGVD